MTFGKIKTIVETNLIESYSKKNDFKRTLKQFKHNVLSNKNMVKVYDLYDQLSTPQGLNESDSKEFLEEGIKVIQTILPKFKLPNTNSETNEYKDIDNLVYLNRTDISERLSSKKNIIKVLMSEKKTIKESINIPIKSMVSIANKTLQSYLENMSESSKREFLKLISEDENKLQEDFSTIQESAISKLNTLLKNENEFEVKTKLSETIERIKSEKFDYLNYIKLKELENSI